MTRISVKRLSTHRKISIFFFSSFMTFFFCRLPFGYRHTHTHAQNVVVECENQFRNQHKFRISTRRWLSLCRNIITNKCKWSRSPWNRRIYWFWFETNEFASRSPETKRTFWSTLCGGNFLKWQTAEHRQHSHVMQCDWRSRAVVSFHFIGYNIFCLPVNLLIGLMSDIHASRVDVKCLFFNNDCIMRILTCNFMQMLCSTVSQEHTQFRWIIWSDMKQQHRRRSMADGRSLVAKL